MHRAVNARNPTACDNLSDPARADVSGGEYAPYFITPFTTGDATNGITTFYYTLSTWNPYVVMLMKSQIQIK